MGTMVVVFLFSALSLGCAWEIAFLAAQPTRIHGVGWPAVTHTFELGDGSPDALTLALKGLPERSEFGDAVMMMRKGRVALRRQFSARERRFVWLYQIEVMRTGTTITLDARETLPPFAMALTLASALALLWTNPVFAVCCLVVVCALVAFRRAKPPLEIESAFAFLEKQIREASEVPSC